MAWYDNTVFYHIYPLGLCGSKHENNGEEENHFEQLNAWVDHIHKLGFTGLYIGPLFESEGHGYETTDYKKVDRRLGTNEDFKQMVKHCHDLGIKVIVDGVFNHTGRSFFAFQDIKQNRENSKYKDWYCNVNFWGNNEYNDGFSYDNWGGYNLLAKLNQWNPEVKNYIFDVVRFWVSEFDIDGIRLDAADVLDHGFMRELRHVTDSLKPEFWLMGEVIHGDYSRWANGDMLHSVTNYELHKGLYSGHNDHNYFEIAHSVKRLLGIVGNTKLYTFMDNHDVERIHTKLNNKDHLSLVTMLVYTLPGIPSMYYGSEFGIDGRKEWGSDWGLRPYLDLQSFGDAYHNNPETVLVKKLGRIKKDSRELAYGEYKELLLTNRQFAYGRILDGKAVITALNNDDNGAHLEIPLPVAASEAINLLDVPEEEVKVEEVKEETPINEALGVAIDTTLFTMQSLSDVLEQLKEDSKTIKVGEQPRDLERLRSCIDQINKDVNGIYQAAGREPENKGIEELANMGSKLEIRDGRLIVDLAPNSGVVVLVK